MPVYYLLIQKAGDKVFKNNVLVWGVNVKRKLKTELLSTRLLVYLLHCSLPHSTIHHATFHDLQ